MYMVLNMGADHFGTLGLETTLQVLIEAWKKNKISSQRLVHIF